MKTARVEVDKSGVTSINIPKYLLKNNVISSGELVFFEKSNGKMVITPIKDFNTINPLKDDSRSE